MLKLFVCSHLLLIIQPVSAQQSTETEVALIKAARSASNAAIARHDAEETAKPWVDQVVSIFSNGSYASGKDSTREVYKKSYESVSDMIWIRTPSEITLSENGTSAWETGTWVGKRTRTNGVKPVGGNYAAMWIKQHGTWKIRSEYFVPLH